MPISIMVVLIFIHSHQQYKTISLLGYGVSSRPTLSKIRKIVQTKKEKAYQWMNVLKKDVDSLQNGVLSGH